MKRIYTADSIAMAWHMRNVLEQHDIYAQVKNEGLSSIAGETPITEILPEVWVKPLYAKRAEQIVKEIINSEELENESWICKSCGEDSLGIFDICWNCQTADN
ncbi:MAG: hypothetical protein CMQ41_01560 [Gammaproteobacteria bacterium]|nr:hypothetical protein [Gammaproteobacteria bacterium]|tara:strand:- start:812 stop:1120 length:309 start_codon:yes stop_codon:yes gene_type:complete